MRDCSHFQRQGFSPINAGGCALVGAFGDGSNIQRHSLGRVAVLGLVVWTVFPEAQTVIACFLAATLIFYVFFAAVKATVRQIVGDQLMELHERLDLMDRKTNALLRNALEQRQLNLRDAIEAAPKQALAVQRRSA